MKPERLDRLAAVAGPLLLACALSAQRLPHRLYDKDGPGPQDGYYSHSIASRPILPGEELLAVDGHYRLLRVHPGPCRPDPDWSWQLN